MLANTVAVAPPPRRNFTCDGNGPQFRPPRSSRNTFLHNPLNSSCGGMKWSTEVPAMVARAGYTRRPLETEGAYEIIDDQTGEKYIVWGGIENSPIPSKEVLGWKPSENDENAATTNKENVTEDNPSTDDINNGNFRHHSDKDQQPPPVRERSKELAGRFGRLKSQKVRDLVQKTRSMVQDKDSRYNKRIVKDAISSSREHGCLEEPKRLDVVKDRWNELSDYELQKPGNVMQKDEIREDVHHSVVAVKHGNAELLSHNKAPKRTMESDIRKAGPDVSVPVVSSSSLRGWDHKDLMHSFRSDLIGTSTKHLKSTVDSNFFSGKSFRDLGCSDFMIEALKSMRLPRPSHIQAMSFGPVNEGKSCIITDQSGSGKTLAYLLPVIQRLRHEELQEVGKALPHNPRVVILVPTAELASQVLSNCRLISKFGVPFRSMVATGGFRQRTQLENLRQDIDVLVATPGRFMFLIKEGFLQLADLRCAVLDEVDILLNNEDFETSLDSLMNSSSTSTQYIFVTATLPGAIYNKLLEVFPDCEVVVGPGAHRTSPGLEEILVDCSGDDENMKTPETAFANKKSALLRLVEENPVHRTIVFCNKIETCRKVENALKRFDRRGTYVKVLPFHAAMEQGSRLANMEEFRSTQLKDRHLFLVCTDRASRGIDFAGVDHVVLFDFPRDPSEYVRRVGRTARGAKGKGKAFIFVVGKQVSLARKIIERNRKGFPLHDVPFA